jgi:small subunit ribosomal protein S16
MATRIRLQRHGRKGRPIFTIVVADSRSKRDGRFIERLGQYNPNTNPATIDLAFDRALDWVMKGAEASDTARAILSYKGVMMKKHLLGGVSKGALTVEQAEDKFNAWLNSKEAQITGKVANLVASKEDIKKARLSAESEVNQKRAASIQAKNTPAVEVVVEAVAEEVIAEAAEESAAVVTEEAAPEAAVAEEAAPEAAVVEEAAPEAVVAEEAAPEAVVAEEAAPEAVVAEEAAPEAAAEEAAAE